MRDAVRSSMGKSNFPGACKSWHHEVNQTGFGLSLHEAPELHTGSHQVLSPVLPAHLDIQGQPLIRVKVTPFVLLGFCSISGIPKSGRSKMVKVPSLTYFPAFPRASPQYPRPVARLYAAHAHLILNSTFRSFSQKDKVIQLNTGLEKLKENRQPFRDRGGTGLVLLKPFHIRRIFPLIQRRVTHPQMPRFRN